MDYGIAEFVDSGVNVDVISPNGTYLGQFAGRTSNSSMVDVTFTLPNPNNECGTFHLHTYHWQFFWYRTYLWEPSSQSYEERTYSPSSYWARDYTNEITQPNYTATPFLANPPEVFYPSDTFDMIDEIDTYPNIACTTNAEISNVALEAINSSLDSNPGNGNPNTNSGLRIFPDKISPADTTNRATVKVKATVTPAVEGIPIYFKTFDLDDPSDNTAPVDSNGSAGDDNRGQVGTSSSGQLNLTTATTNSSGIAVVELTVTKQPGDNFAVVASKAQAFLDGVAVDGTNLKNGSQTIPLTGQTTTTNPAMRTEMLTIWRKLHIESDSMGVVTGNKVNGTISALGQSCVGGICDNGFQTSLTSLEEERFQQGKILVAGYSYDVKTNGSNGIVILNGQPFGSNSIPLGSSFVMYDDDDMNDDGVLDGDEGDEVVDPDTSLLTNNSSSVANNLFATGYIVPAYDLGGNDGNVASIINVGGDVNAPDIAPFYTNFNNYSYHNDDDFWVIYLLGGYQFTTDRDGDPRLISATTGQIGTIYGLTDTPQRQRIGRGSIIFNEDARPHEFPGGTLASRAITADHEVGHLFGCDHADGGIMAPTAIRSSTALSPACLVWVRDTRHP
ncbi:MAG: hypothetical protein ACK5NT_11750 [Pyrinomonadaceae bacterium]